MYQWNLPLFDELEVPYEKPLRSTSFTGDPVCLLESLRESCYFLLSALLPLSFLVTECGSHRYPDDARSIDETSLPPPPCISEAKLDLA